MELLKLTKQDVLWCHIGDVYGCLRHRQNTSWIAVGF